MALTLYLLDAEFTVCKATDFSEVDLTQEYCFLGKTDEECSIVCPTEQVPGNVTERDDGWRGFRIQGVLDFSLMGILAPIATMLAENKIGIFAVSTFNTDYILVKKENMAGAMTALREAGYSVEA